MFAFIADAVTLPPEFIPAKADELQEKYAVPSAFSAVLQRICAI